MRSIRRELTIVASIAVCIAATFSGPRMLAAEPEAQPVLTVVNVKGESFKFSLEDLRKLPRKQIKATDHSKEEHVFDGVAMSEVLKAAHVPLGKDLRGPLLTNYVLVEAKDKYRAVFALPECDPESTDNVVLVADTQDGKPIPDTHAPLRIVLAHEKRHSRWVRQVIKISVLQSPESATGDAAK